MRFHRFLSRFRGSVSSVLTVTGLYPLICPVFMLRIVLLDCDIGKTTGRSRSVFVRCELVIITAKCKREEGGTNLKTKRTAKEQQ